MRNECGRGLDAGVNVRSATVVLVAEVALRMQESSDLAHLMFSKVADSVSSSSGGCEHWPRDLDYLRQRAQRLPCCVKGKAAATY